MDHKEMEMKELGLEELDRISGGEGNPWDECKKIQG